MNYNNDKKNRRVNNLIELNTVFAVFIYFVISKHILTQRGRIM